MLKSLLFRGIGLLIVLMFFLTSCGLPPPGTALTPEERENAKKKCILQHVAVGAGSGALVGALLGRRDALKGAVIGGLAGGALGYLIAWGKCVAYFSDLNTFPVAGYQETAKNERYRPNEGNVVKIKNFSSSPKEVRTGGKVQLNGSYYVMAPEDIKDVKVREKRIYYYYDTTKNEWVELGPVENEVTASLGTRRADGSVDIASDLPEGKYRVDFVVSALGKEDSASTEYVVKKSFAKSNEEKILF